MVPERRGHRQLNDVGYLGGDSQLTGSCSRPTSAQKDQGYYLNCQLALNINPLSASKIDPPQWASGDGVGALRSRLIHALCTDPRASNTRAGRCSRGG